MNKVFMVVTETDRSDGVFSSPDKAAAWYWSSELEESKDNTIQFSDGKVYTLEDMAKEMMQSDSSYPKIVTLSIDGESVEIVDA